MTTMPSGWIELAAYLGQAFQPRWMTGNDQLVLAEARQYATAEAFYRHSEIYLYHLTAYFLEGWKRPGYAWLLQALSGSRQQTVLDYGCGIGSDGLWLLEQNIAVNFAEYDNPCRRYLQWRLEQRPGIQTTLYDLTAPIPCHDIVWCMDVLEHLPPVTHAPFLLHLATLGTTVFVNLVDDKEADGFLHHPVDVEGLTAVVTDRWGYASWDWHHRADGGKVRFLTYGPLVQPMILRGGAAPRSCHEGVVHGD